MGEADLELVDGSVRVAGAPDRQLSLGQLAKAAAPGLPLPAGMEPGLEATHYFPAPHATFGSGVHIAVVSVDRETGEIEIVDYAVVSDAGRLINALRVVTMEAEPRVLELHGDDVQKANHAYRTNGIITELEMPLGRPTRGSIRS